ncbi:uroporphyrinogen-III synthase [Comamonas sp.]
MRTVVVTRPQPDAGLWVQHLQGAGLHAQALPMIVIGASRNPAAVQAVQEALAQLPTFEACMFVSGNAVRHFFAALQGQDIHLPPGLRFWAPGPGTAQALLTQGIAPHRIDQPAANAAQFDSEALWSQVEVQVHASSKVLIVRGGDGQQTQGNGRQWLTQQLQQRGAQVTFAPVYERLAPSPTRPLLDEIAALRGQQAIWLFSSSECVQHLVLCNPAHEWQSHTALATHPRIAQQARHAGFGQVIETLPTLQSITASIKSLHDSL